MKVFLVRKKKPFALSFFFSVLLLTTVFPSLEEREIWTVSPSAARTFLVDSFDRQRAADFWWRRIFQFSFRCSSFPWDDATFKCTAAKVNPMSVSTRNLETINLLSIHTGVDIRTILSCRIWNLNFLIYLRINISSRKVWHKSK